jgi:hypothetical protein
MDDLPFQGASPDGKTVPAPWYVRAWQLINREGYTSDAAVEAVILLYLDAADLRPLFDATGNGYCPTVKVLANFSSLFPSIGVNQIRRGQHGPKKPTNVEKIIFHVLKNGVKDTALGKDPGQLFWDFLWAAFEPERRHVVERKRRLQGPFSIEAKMLGAPGRPSRSLDLETRDEMLAWFVQARLAKAKQAGERKKLKDEIIPAVTEEWNSNAKVCGVPPVSTATVWAAYNQRHRRPK